MDVSADLPVMFRAGRGPSPVPAAQAMPPDFGAEVTLLADCSEFQPAVNVATYVRWSQAVVIRAAYGASHDDRAWAGGARRAAFHAGGIRFLGIYGYMVASQDPVSQARELCRLIGAMQPGEKIICDLEEGAGNQAARLAAWKQVVRDSLGDEPWTYSGLWFSQSSGIAPVDWVAAYGQSEPSVTHKLWQFSDSYSVPGVGTADCSVFHGTIDQLAGYAHGGTQPVKPSTPTWTATLIANLPVLSLGSSGDDVKSCQGLLNARGYALKIDGAYGPATRSAVTAFQHAKGLAADGACGPKTWAKLLNR